MDSVHDMPIAEIGFVTEVVDGDTFVIGNPCNPTIEGIYIRPTGYNAPEKGEPDYQEMKEELKKIILGREVYFHRVSIKQNRFICDVYLDDKLLIEHFPKKYRDKYRKKDKK